MLGVRPGADPDTVREAYLRLARRHHPDVVGGDAARMRAVNEAWATLGDPGRRARYDETLGDRTSVASSRRSPAAGAEPDPPYDPYDAYAESSTPADWDELDDDRPLGGTVVLPRWLRLVPVGTFAASVVIFWVGVLFTAESLLALALMTFVLACVFFLAAPFMALLASRRSEVRHRS